MRSENLRRLYYHYYTTPSSPLIDPRQLSHDDLIFLAEYHLEECKQVYKLMLVSLKQHRFKFKLTRRIAIKIFFIHIMYFHIYNDSYVDSLYRLHTN